MSRRASADRQRIHDFEYLSDCFLWTPLPKRSKTGALAERRY
jgi:hypothetical protein